MAKVFIHIGLPKTATTTLQTDVFPHLDNSIFYVGVHQPRSSYKSDLYVKFMKSIRYGSDIALTKSMLMEQLSTGRNILISEENICVSESMATWEKKIERLSCILNGLNYKIIVTIREPSKAIYSYYVELNDLFRKKKKSFIDIALNDESMKIYHYTFFFNFISNNFDVNNLHVFKFEDIVKGEISGILELLEQQNCQDNFRLSNNNSKNKNNNYILIKKKQTILTFFLEYRLINYLVDFLNIKRYRFLYKFLFNIRMKKNIKIKKPNNQEIKQLSNSLRSDIDFVNKMFKVDF